MTNVQEIFLPIDGFEGLYEVGDQGNVKTIERPYFAGAAHSIIRVVEEKLKSNTKDKDGYRVLSLSKNGKKYFKRIARLVCKAFHPNPENKRFVNHKNGVKHDDRASNLEWSTQSENELHNYHVLNRPLSGVAAFKKVVQMGMDGVKIKEFSSLKAAELEGFGRHEICNAANGRIEKYKGFKWAYA